MGRIALLGAAIVALSGAAACARGGDKEERASVAAKAPAPSVESVPAPRLEGWTATEHAAHGDAARGKELLARYECNRCHEGTGLAAPPLDQQCVGCHALVSTGKVPMDPARLSAMQAATRHYLAAPSLAEIGHTERASWIATFLQEPGKVRPHIEEGMPRMRISEGDARDMAAAITLGAPEPIEAAIDGDAARGKEIVAQRGCFVCHEFTGAARSGAKPSLPDIPGDRLSRGILQAPDLRLARERVRPDEIVQWIVDPSRVRKDAIMPALGLSERDAKDAAAYVMTTPLAAPPPAPPPIERLPVLDRKVTYDEVATRVFRKSCVHCHSDDEGSPGSTGGFGFAPRGVRLLSYEGTQAGYLDDDGTRRSLFAREPALERWGGARIVAALVARHEEAAGRPVTEVRGMPMGIPPLSREDIQLVESWAAQGAPRQ